VRIQKRSSTSTGLVKKIFLSFLIIKIKHRYLSRVVVLQKTKRQVSWLTFISTFPTIVSGM